MKDKIVEMVASKVGISPEQASSAVDAVLGYLKENPEQISSLVGVSQDNMLDDAKEKLGGIGGKVGKLFKR